MRIVNLLHGDGPIIIDTIETNTFKSIDFDCLFFLFYNYFIWAKRKVTVHTFVCMFTFKCTNMHQLFDKNGNGKLINDTTSCPKIIFPLSLKRMLNASNLVCLLAMMYLTQIKQHFPIWFSLLCWLCVKMPYSKNGLNMHCTILGSVMLQSTPRCSDIYDWILDQAGVWHHRRQIEICATLKKKDINTSSDENQVTLAFSYYFGLFCICLFIQSKAAIYWL